MFAYLTKGALRVFKLLLLLPLCLFVFFVVFRFLFFTLAFLRALRGSTFFPEKQPVFVLLFFGFELYQTESSF
jgi:hypothetical protein